MMSSFFKSTSKPSRNFSDASSMIRWKDDPSSSLNLKISSNVMRVDEELNGKIALWKGDMTKLKIGAIVNAANRSLMGGGGIDGAIHAAAGFDLKMECKTLGGCEIGKTKRTGAYNLPCDHILHTVGPVYNGSNKCAELLSSCYWTCLEVARANCIRSVCFCCISTGIYGYPNRSAAEIALQTVRKWYSFMIRLMVMKNI